MYQLESLEDVTAAPSLGVRELDAWRAPDQHIALRYIGGIQQVHLLGYAIGVVLLECFNGPFVLIQTPQYNLDAKPRYELFL